MLVLGATGDAIAMVEPLNADLIDMDLINTQPHSMILPSGLGHIVIRVLVVLMA